MLIGFGSTETDREKAEEEAIREGVAELYAKHKEDYITEALVEDFREWLDARGKALRAEDASYRNAETYPDRYGYYHATVASDASHIFVYLRWLHTNRRHALSPDGWACIQTRQVFVVDRLDDLERLCAA